MLYKLTKRQIEVLQLIADGRTTDEIADGMGLSSETIKSHVKGIVKAMGATNRAHAAAEGVRKGIIF